MTILTKPLRREVLRTMDLDRFTRGRTIIVELEPPDLVHFRFKGTRKRYTANVTRLVQWTIQETVRREREAKKKGRKA